MAADFSNRLGVDLAIKDLGVDVAARLHALLPLAAPGLPVCSAAVVGGVHVGWVTRPGLRR